VKLNNYLPAKGIGARSGREQRCCRRKRGAALAIAGAGACLAMLPAANGDEIVQSSGTYPLSGLRDGYTANQTFSGTLGYTFTTGVSPLTVTSLGYYDGPNSSAANTSGYIADGLQSPHQVGVWDSNGTLLTSVTVTTAGTALNDFRYVALSAPLTLPAQSSFTVGGLVTPADATTSGDVFYTVTNNTLFGPGTNVFNSSGVFTYNGSGTVLAQPTSLSTQGFLGPNLIYTVPVAVNNGTFTKPTTGGYTTVNSAVNQSWNAAITNWGATVTNTSNYGSVGVIGNTTFGGTQAAYINATGNDIFQDLGTLAPDTLYTLTVDENLRADGGAGAAGVVSLLLGNSDAGTVVSSTPFTALSAATPVVVEYQTGATVSGDLTVELADTAGAGSQSIAFSNVSMITVPEPAEIGLMGAAMLGQLRRRRYAAR
jgi:hypothetical protein